MIKNESWKTIKASTKDSLFVKNLATAIWTKHTLANRCVELKDDLIAFPNRSPRKELTPKNKRVVKGVYT